MVDERSAMVCEFDEVPEMAERIESRVIKKECLEIYEDIKNRRRNMIYEF